MWGGGARMIGIHNCMHIIQMGLGAGFDPKMEMLSSTLFVP